MVESECWECVCVCVHPLGMDGRRCLSVQSVCVCAPTGDGRPKVSECAECVHVCTRVCSPQLRVWVRVCLVPVDRGWGEGGVCLCVCVCVWLSFHSV